MHMRINTIYDALGVVEAPQLSAWGHHWDAEYSQLVQWLVAEAERFNATRLRAEVKNNPIKIRDFLAIIKLQLAVHAEGQDQTTDAVDQEMDAPDQGIDAPDVDMDKETKCSDMSTVDDMMALMRSTLDKLTDPDVDPGEINTWFIPREGVIYDKKNPFGQGFFSLFYKGTWVGSDEAVGIKTLDENDNGATFSREFSTWWLLRHPNILEMYGANHIETPSSCASSRARISSRFSKTVTTATCCGPSSSRPRKGLSSCMGIRFSTAASRSATSFWQRMGL
jgi:hypothetical protein